MVKVFVLSFFAFCLLPPESVGNEGDELAVRAFIQGANELGIKMIKYQLSANPDSNVCVAPLPFSAICLTFAKAGEGNSKTELEKTVLGTSYEHFSQNGEDIHKVIHNAWRELRHDLFNPEKALFLHSYTYTDTSIVFEDSFISYLKSSGARVLRSQLKAQPEKSIRSINKRVKQDTNGVIDKLLTSDDITPFTRLILLNVMGFKAKWKTPFPIEGKGRFNVAGKGQKVRTSFLRDYSCHEFAITEEFSLIYRDYKDSPYYFVAILPKEGDSLSEFITSKASLFLDKSDSSSCVSLIAERIKEKKVPRNSAELFLPAFNVKTKTMNLSPFLKSEGVDEGFTDEAKFPGISKEPFKLGFFAQKNSFKIDKEGTEAYSASSAGGDIFGGLPVRIIFDRPFFYGLLDIETGVFLFMGVVNDPTKN